MNIYCIVVLICVFIICTKEALIENQQSYACGNDIEVPMPTVHGKEMEISVIHG